MGGDHPFSNSGGVFECCYVREFEYIMSYCDLKEPCGVGPPTDDVLI